MHKHKRPTNLLSLSHKKSFQQRRRRRKKWTKMKWKCICIFKLFCHFWKVFQPNLRVLDCEKVSIETRKFFNFIQLLFFQMGHARHVAGIRTHNLQNKSLLPWPLDLFYRPSIFWCNKVYHTVHQLFIRSRGSMYLTYLRISLLQQKYHSMLGSRCLPAVS